MQYICLIYSQEGGPDDPEVMKRYGALVQELREAGKMVGGERLQPSTAATTVRIRNGETLTTDGPFAETKEVLGGYFVLECENLDEALAYAERIPAAEHGSVEVRPIAPVPARV